MSKCFFCWEKEFVSLTKFLWLGLGTKSTIDYKSCQHSWHIISSFPLYKDLCPSSDFPTSLCTSSPSHLVHRLKSQDSSHRCPGFLLPFCLHWVATLVFRFSIRKTWPSHFYLLSLTFTLSNSILALFLTFQFSSLIYYCDIISTWLCHCHSQNVNCTTFLISSSPNFIGMVATLGQISTISSSHAVPALQRFKYYVLMFPANLTQFSSLTKLVKWT